MVQCPAGKSHFDEAASGDVELQDPGSAAGLGGRRLNPGCIHLKSTSTNVMAPFV